ncbi:MAG: GGDEF domain-containing protein [Armatimonadetes bacterium]|nr:GGDEF domain-containing protein [Armatimonadota bacterium]
MCSLTGVRSGNLCNKVLEALPQPLFIIDHSHVVVFANKCFRDLFGMGVHDVLGKSLWDIWNKEKYSDLFEAYSDSIETGEPRQVTLESMEHGSAHDIWMQPVEDLLIVLCTDIWPHLSMLREARGAFEALARINEELRTSHQMANSDSRTDVLTGLCNRRRFAEIADVAFPALIQRGVPCSFITLDIDHFKQFNDEFGHAEGDKVLAAVGRVLLDFANEMETPARIGGEEFVLLCPQIGLREAMVRATELLARITAIEGTAMGVTASIGVASACPEDDGWFKPLSRADKALYAAKRGGRNQVVSCSMDFELDAA